MSLTPEYLKSVNKNKSPVPFRALVLAFAMAAAYLLFTPGAAQAEEAADTNLTEFSESDILRAAQEGDTVASGSEAEAAVDEHLESSMRSGQLLDVADLNVATLEDPADPSGEVSVTWSDASKVTALAVATAEVPAGEPVPTVGMGAILENVVEEDQIVGSGAGFSLLGDPPSGYHSEGWDCSWVTKSQEGGDPHQLNTCYEKFHSNDNSQGGTRNWIYNRHSSLQLSTSIYFTYKVQDFTVRGV